MPRRIPDAVLAVMLLPTVQPVEIYELYITPTDGSYDTPSHRFAACETDITFGGNLYTKLGIQRGTGKYSSDLQVDNITVGLDNVDRAFSSLIAQDLHLFRHKRIVIKTVFRDLLDDAANHIMVFDGTVDDPNVDEGIFSAKVNSWLTLQMIWPRRIYRGTCGLQFGDQWCSVDKEDTVIPNRKNGVADPGSATTYLIDADVLTQADDWWVDGYVEMRSGNNNGLGRRVVSSDQSETKVTIDVPFPYTVAAGDDFVVWRGCSKTQADCQTKFSNIDNYGGTPYIPRDPTLKVKGSS